MAKHGGEETNIKQESVHDNVEEGTSENDAAAASSLPNTPLKITPLQPSSPSSRRQTSSENPKENYPAFPPPPHPNGAYGAPGGWYPSPHPYDPYAPPHYGAPEYGGYPYNPPPYPPMHPHGGPPPPPSPSASDPKPSSHHQTSLPPHHHPSHLPYFPPSGPVPPHVQHAVPPSHQHPAMSHLPHHYHPYGPPPPGYGPPMPPYYHPHSLPPPHHMHHHSSYPPPPLSPTGHPPPPSHLMQQPLYSPPPIGPSQRRQQPPPASPASRGPPSTLPSLDPNEEGPRSAGGGNDLDRKERRPILDASTPSSRPPLFPASSDLEDGKQGSSESGVASSEKQHRPAFHPRTSPSVQDDPVSLTPLPPRPVLEDTSSAYNNEFKQTNNENRSNGEYDSDEDEDEDQSNTDEESARKSHIKRPRSEQRRQSDGTRVLQPTTLKTYYRPKVVNMEQETRRQRKNAQSRVRATRKREEVEAIRAKPEHERTEEEQKMLDSFDNKRERKNNRSRLRALEIKERVDTILAKPTEQRTKIELAFLEQHMERKSRKNEGDRLRRQRLKMLGLNRYSKGEDSDQPTAKKPKVTARGPLPAISTVADDDDEASRSINPGSSEQESPHGGYTPTMTMSPIRYPHPPPHSHHHRPYGPPSGPSPVGPPPHIYSYHHSHGPPQPHHHPVPPYPHSQPPPPWDGSTQFVYNGYERRWEGSGVVADGTANDDAPSTGETTAVKSSKISSEHVSPSNQDVVHDNRNDEETTNAIEASSSHHGKVNGSVQDVQGLKASTAPPVTATTYV